MGADRAWMAKNMRQAGKGKGGIVQECRVPRGPWVMKSAAECQCYSVTSTYY